MYSALGSIRAAIAFLVVWTFASNTAYPQTAKFAGHAADQFLLADLPLASTPCARGSANTFAAPRPATAGPGCDTPSTASQAVHPCDGMSLIRTGCEVPRDLVQADLDAMGTDGQKISLARERVFEILQTENACTAWFREKDPNPAATFRTLNFFVDRKGEDFILDSTDSGSSHVYQHPYVAKVFQADGPHATVTINRNGAFFSPLARVVEVRKGGGPFSLHGLRILSVGPYVGNTPRAQVVALLHEFGHVLDLLPADENNVDGKSVHNTSEVLHFCRAEVDASVKHKVLSAAR